MRPSSVVGETVQLEDGSVEIRPMADYLLVVERGTISSLADVRHYTRALEKARDRHGMRLLVVDARIDPERIDPTLREAYWRWLATGAFDRVALVADGDMRTTELNMKALSEGMSVRAFTDLGDARAWVRPGGRSSVMPPPPKAVAE